MIFLKLIMIFLDSKKGYYQTLNSELIRDDKDNQLHKEEKRLSAFPLTIYPQTFALPSNKASNEEVVLIREKVSLP